MTRNLTKPERNVLGHIPGSTQSAFVRSSAIKDMVGDIYDYKSVTVKAIWNRLLESKLIEEMAGRCRRTPEGDRALEPVAQEEII